VVIIHTKEARKKVVFHKRPLQLSYLNEPYHGS
jgi:hypothetical protein